jgi:hypothetical protein
MQILSGNDGRSKPLGAGLAIRRQDSEVGLKYEYDLMPDSMPDKVCHKYCLYGLVVESEPRLTSVKTCHDGRPPAITIVAAGDEFFERRAAGLRQDCEEWIRHTVLADGSVYMRVNDVFEAIVAAGGRRVASAKLGAVDDRTFEANLVNFALSASLTLQGEECLHATVVALNDGAVGLLGPSGSGKSTLSAFLLAQGASLITDDMLRATFVGNDVVAHPGPRRLKLFEDSAQRLLSDAAKEGSFNRLSRKMMYEPRETRETNPTGHSLAALFWVGEEGSPASDPQVSVRRLAGIEPVKILTGSTMNTRYTVPERLERQLRFAERMARAVPIFALKYPRDYAVLDEVAEAMHQAISA